MTARPEGRGRRLLGTRGQYAPRPVSWTANQLARWFRVNAHRLPLVRRGR